LQTLQFNDIGSYVDMASATSDVQPQDSASQVGTGSSLSTRSSVKARIAGVRARAEALQRMQQLERGEQRIKQQRAQLAVDTEIAVAEAEMQEFDMNEIEAEDNELHFRTVTGVHKSLNPEAAEWKPEQNDSAATIPALQADEANGYGNGLLTLQQQLLATVHLPQAKIMTFDGNPLEYWNFIRSFENSIESVCVDDTSKLIRLLQYCVGKAKQVIQCCTVMDPSEGYKQARKLLRERFGNNYRISEAWIVKVN